MLILGLRDMYFDAEVVYVTYSTTNQRLVEVQFGRYQKNILQE